MSNLELLQSLSDIYWGGGYSLYISTVPKGVGSATLAISRVWVLH